MTDRTHPDSGRIITSSDILLHDAKTALLYEELRAAIDDGHESMTHADALAEIAAIRAENEKLEAQLEAIGAGGVSGPLVGRTSISANAGEPRALNPRHIRKFLQALQAGEMSVSRAVEILDAWVGGYYEDEMVPLPPPDSCLIADDEFPMEIVRKLRSELAAAPPTAQAEGWRLVPVEPTQKMLFVAMNAFVAASASLGAFNAPDAAYRALLAAAPTHPTSSVVVEHG